MHRMEFIASLDSLDQMMHYICDQARLQDVKQELLNKIELACEEAIVNIISYAYCNQRGMVSIVCEKIGNRFEVVLRDRGKPFNPIDVEINPQFGTPVQKRKVGGMGIFLIRKVIDDVSYFRENNENILNLAFNLL